jgi:hypothetical protein
MPAKKPFKFIFYWVPVPWSLLSSNNEIKNIIFKGKIHETTPRRATEQIYY